jgi:hypothetical protein
MPPLPPPLAALTNKTNTTTTTMPLSARHSKKPDTPARPYRPSTAPNWYKFFATLLIFLLVFGSLWIIPAIGVSYWAMAMIIALLWFCGARIAQ